MKGFFRKYLYETIISLGILLIVVSSSFIVFMGEGIKESYAVTEGGGSATITYSCKKQSKTIKGYNGGYSTKAFCEKEEYTECVKVGSVWKAPVYTYGSWQSCGTVTKCPSSTSSMIYSCAIESCGNSIVHCSSYNANCTKCTKCSSNYEVKDGACVYVGDLPDGSDYTQGEIANCALYSFKAYDKWGNVGESKTYTTGCPNAASYAHPECSCQSCQTGYTLKNGACIKSASCANYSGYSDSPPRCSADEETKVVEKTKGLFCYSECKKKSSSTPQLACYLCNGKDYKWTDAPGSNCYLISGRTQSTCKADSSTPTCPTGYTKYDSEGALDKADENCYKKGSNYIFSSKLDGNLYCGKCEPSSLSTAPATAGCYSCDNGTYWTSNPVSNKNCELISTSTSIKSICNDTYGGSIATYCNAQGYIKSNSCSYGSTQVNGGLCDKWFKCNANSSPRPEVVTAPPIASPGTTPVEDSGTLVINNPGYETTPQIVVPSRPVTTEKKEIVAYLISTSPLMPKANDPKWVPWTNDKIDFYLDAGTYYLYVKDTAGNVFELDKLVVDVAANNILDQVQIIINGSVNKIPIYYGKMLGVYGADEGSGYQTFTSNTTFGSKLSIDKTTGLVMYRLEASEKSSLGISVDKIYVVGSKDKTTVSREGENVFAVDGKGNITAASHGILGTVYEISPKSPNGSIPKNNFYAIRLDTIVKNDCLKPGVSCINGVNPAFKESYKDPNSWNNMNLLHYSQYKYTNYDDPNTKTTDKISGSTDFSFKVLRTGWNQIAIADNYYSNSTIRLLSASYNEIAANNDGTIYIDTKSNVTQYEATVNASEIAINPILVYTDSTFVEGYGPRTVKLSYGLNVIDIKVKSAKGTVRTYTFLITRPDNRSSDNTLSSLSLSAGNLNPKFNSYTNEYKTSVKNNVTKITVGAKLNNGGAEFISGFGPRTVDLKEGNNTVYVKVKSQTGTQRVYKITIKRAAATPEETPSVDQTKSSNNYLNSLYLSAGNLTFNKTTTEYNIYVTNDIKSILIKPEVEDSKATYQLEGPSELAIGSNLYKITVTAENGNTKIYNLNVIRKELGLAVTNIKTLKSLEIAGHKISFDPDNYLYKLTIKPKVKELDIKAIANNERSDIVIEGNMELTSFSDIKVKVIAEDGSYSIYDINITVNRTNILRDALIGFGYVVVLGLIVWAGYKKGKTMRKR